MNWFFRISVLLNAALLVAAVLVLRKPNPPPSAAIALVVPSTATTPTDDSPVVLSEPAIAATIVLTNAFHWQVLEATNYDTFVANLRHVGCPERTIRDLLFADASRRYAAAEVATTEKLPFWLAGRALVAAERRAETNRSTLQVAVIADLKRLFAVDWAPEDMEMHDLQVQALTRIIVGPVSDEVHERAWRWLLATIQQQKSFQRARNNILLEADHVAWRDIVAERKAQAALIFDPGAFEEFQARSTVLEEVFEREFAHLPDLELTAGELRQLSLVKVRQVGWLDTLFERERDRSEADTTTQRVAFTAALKDVLTPAHFEEFVRVQDSSYREILEVTRDHDLPRTAAQKVYEVQQLARLEAQRLRAEADSPEIAEAMAELQATTASSIRKIMGAEAFHKFTTGRGQWVTNFSKL